MTESDYKRTTCVQCNAALGYSRQRRIYCGNACKLAAWKAANPEKHKARAARYQAKPRAQAVCAIHARYCRTCSKPFVSRTAKVNCSRDCDKQAARNAALAAALAAHRATARVSVCECCHIAFCPVYGASHAALCGTCGLDRRREHKRTHRLARKARQRGAQVEAVNPIKVFERDDWKCRLCGIRTPKSKRGTQDDDAPELDHIIPLSRNGEHSYRNTQCACRKCNAAKANKPLGQLLLIG